MYHKFLDSVTMPKGGPLLTSLHIINMLADDATFHSQSAIQPIHITPLEANGFAYAQTKAYTRGPECGMVPPGAARTLGTFPLSNCGVSAFSGCSLDRDKFHRVTLGWDVSSAKPSPLGVFEAGNSRGHGPATTKQKRALFGHQQTGPADG